MAGLIPQAFIDDLLNRTDIVETIDKRVSLKKTGKNYSACCPFHQEKTPSFSVQPTLSHRAMVLLSRAHGGAGSSLLTALNCLISEEGCGLTTAS